MRVAETGVGEFGCQLRWVVQIRGREILSLGAAVLTVRKVLPDNWCVPRVSEEMADQSIESGGKPRNGRYQHDTVRAQDPKALQAGRQALSVVWRAQAALLVFESEFAHLSVNAVYMVNRSTLEQAVTAPSLRGRIQASRMVAHAASGTLGILLGGVLGEQLGTSATISVGVIGGLFSFVWLWLWGGKT